MKTTAKTLFQGNPKRNQLLDSFEKEYREALTKSNFINNNEESSEVLECVVNKYMEMDTELFDSDGLNEVIDKIHDEFDNQEDGNEK
jgi:hypothetical protein